MNKTIKTMDNGDFEATSSPNSHVELIKSLGYRVFMHERSDTWCHYTDGTRIAYCQWGERAYGMRVATVHKPNRATGTGFVISETIDVQSLTAAINCIAPSWASRSDAASVKKWKDWDEFHNSNQWHRQYVEV